MANKLQLKRSAVPGKVPTTADLQLGEIAINTYDGKAYMKKNVSGVESIVLLVGSGSGDVTGPASAADNAIARFDTTSGKLIQNSSATIDDSGNVSATSQQSTGTAADKLPVGTTAQRPTGATGMIRFNSERNVFEGYDNTGWTAINAPPLSVDYLVVAGGGGGGGYGGGGGGGVLTGTSTAFVRGNSYTVTIGSGGAGGPGNGGDSGTNSVVAGVVAIGGGGGAGDTIPTGKNGGSGGGGNRSSGGGGLGTSGQGNNGGSGSSSNGNGGGGGGWGAVGGTSSGLNGGGGGAGSTSAITGTTTYYAGGGGSGANIVVGANVAGAGGNGGGGNGGTMNDATIVSNPVAGTANRGGGGGGRGYGSGGLPGANGGSGIVVLRYPDAYTLVIGAGLTSTTTSSGGLKTTVFTAGSDTIQWSA